MKLVMIQKAFIAFELKAFKKNFKNFIGNKNIFKNISRMQAYNLVIRRFFPIGFLIAFFQRQKFEKLEKVIFTAPF